MATNYGTVLHYWNGMALCEDRYGDLYYVEIPEEYAELGSAMDFDDLTPIEALGTDGEQEVREVLAAVPQEQIEWARETYIDLPGE